MSMRRNGGGGGGGNNNGGGFVVKNRAPAPIQISAEQILREAADRQETFAPEAVVQVHDAEEYQNHLRDRRKLFEDNIRYRREHIGNWVKYARFEEDNQELERARSVFERALEVDVRSAELYLRYAEMEMRHECINHARNILDRGVQLLPRVDFLWYKYVYMEEMVGDIPKCRAVFERWMKWMPDDNAWLSYSRFENRCGQPKQAEAILRRYVNAYPTARAFLRFAKWAEYEAKDTQLARTIYEACLSELEPEESKQARVFKQFAAFEERQHETERARVLYRHAVALFHLDGSSGSSSTNNKNQADDDDDDDISDYEKAKRKELYQAYVTFEKKHGDRERIEKVLLANRRAAYRQATEADPYDYDSWFEWAKMEEDHLDTDDNTSTDKDGTSHSSLETVREVYERAVAQVPPTRQNKDHWRRYIYLWIYYAVFEELTAKNQERASQVYETCLSSVIPHKQFSFAKIWIYAAQLYIRRKNLAAARKLLGKAIGMCGKEIIFVEYIKIELALGEVDRCRTLYTQYLKAMPDNCVAWSKYAELEKSAGETERCRALYELAISQPSLDMPEMLWKSYIDFEIEEGEIAKVRQLYERLLERTGGHVKVYISYAQFEATNAAVPADAAGGGGGGMDAARKIMSKAYEQLKQQPDKKEERVLLLDAWRVLEKTHGDKDQLKAVEAKLPRRIKRKRKRQDDDGNELEGWEEFFDYQFPDDDDDANSAAKKHFKILEMAAQWKQQNQNQQDSDDDDSDDD